MVSRFVSVDGCQTIPQAFLHGVQRIVRWTAGAKAVDDGQKVRLEDRLQDQLGRRLDHPISDRRDSQRAVPAIRLRDQFQPPSGYDPQRVGSPRFLISLSLRTVRSHPGRPLRCLH